MGNPWGFPDPTATALSPNEPEAAAPGGGVSVPAKVRPVQKFHRNPMPKNWPWVAGMVGLIGLIGLLLVGIVCHGCHSHEEELRLREFLPSAYAAEPVPATGQITGIVRFTGTIPPPRRVETNDGTTIEIADLRVDPQTKGLAEVLVFVENPPLTKSPPPRQAAVIDQVNWLFRPRVVGIVAGQEVRFENNDTCNHSVQTQSSNPTNQINAAAGPGVPIIHRFEAQRDPIPVSCALHPWMRAYLFVSPHPFFAVTDERGEFALPKLPPGEYRLRWLHPISRLQTHREVTVAAQTTARLNIVWDRLPDSQ
jgi:plastocyanin